MWVLRYMGSNKCTILYIMVWVGIFELAVSKVRDNSGQSNWVKVSRGKAQEIEKIKSKSHHVGSQINGVKQVHYIVYNGMGIYFRVSSK